MAQFNNHTNEILDKFEQRMKFVNIVKCITDYSIPDAVRAMIPDKDSLDNMIVAVLVYIMDHTLRYDEQCTMADISEFLEEFASIFKTNEWNTTIITRHIVIEVLQNGGKMREFAVYDSESGEVKQVSIRLVAQEKDVFRLTDDAYDFLFRTKEIDTELDFSVARFKLNELLKRNNYTDALAQSRELVNRIRSMKASMKDFLLRCRENISKITVDEYDKIILRTRTLLESEYEELENIQKVASSKLTLLKEALNQGADLTTTRQSKIAVDEIIHNITITIEEQRSLINKKTSLSDSYRQLINENFVVHNYKRFRIEDEILAPFWALDNDKMGDMAKFLLFPLCRPLLNGFFSVENFFATQQKLRETEEETFVDISGGENYQEILRNERNQRFKNIIKSLFTYMCNQNRFTIKEYIESLSVKDTLDFCCENSLPNVILAIYEMKEIDIEGWKKEKNPTFDPLGEFELSWCLEELSEDLLSMSKFIIENTGIPFNFTVSMMEKTRTIEMSDFKIEVVR